jgi:hypothetical protein
MAASHAVAWYGPVPGGPWADYFYAAAQVSATGTIDGDTATITALATAFVGLFGPDYPGGDFIGFSELSRTYEWHCEED